MTTSSLSPAPSPRPVEDGALIRWHRLGLGYLALAAWCILIVASLVANASFARGFGSSELEHNILMGAAVASDLLKSLSPMAFLYFLAQRRWWPAMAALICFLVAFTFSVIASIGFVSKERVGAHEKAVSEEAEAKRQRDEAVVQADRNKWLTNTGGPVLPASVLTTKIEAAKLDKLFKATEACTVLGSPKPIPRYDAWCKDYRQMTIDLAMAQAREVGETKVAQKLEFANKTERANADHQVESLAGWTGISAEKILLALTCLTVALIEIGSSFGMTVGLTLIRPERIKIDKAKNAASATQAVPKPAGIAIQTMMPVSPAAFVSSAPSPAPIAAVAPAVAPVTPVAAMPTIVNAPSSGSPIPFTSQYAKAIASALQSHPFSVDPTVEILEVLPPEPAAEPAAGPVVPPAPVPPPSVGGPYRIDLGGGHTALRFPAKPRSAHIPDSIAPQGLDTADSFSGPEVISSTVIETGSVVPLRQKV